MESGASFGSCYDIRGASITQLRDRVVPVLVGVLIAEQLGDRGGILGLRLLEANDVGVLLLHVLDQVSFLHAFGTKREITRSSPMMENAPR